ncbi:hypothetical protein ABC347_04095 [Sphingomonas sp. 1P06PA]|uniref:hypothetical protein n=1 Tax=Sphingomonas sp. 1P06PA TaxID=554121 RepID=UPI0039A5543C
MLLPQLAISADPLTNGALSFERRGDRWRSLWFVCDGVDRQEIALIGHPSRSGDAIIRRLAKPGFKVASAAFRVGPGDPGAGQIYFPLKAGSGRDAGALHAVNPGMYPAPTPALPSFTSIDQPSGRMRCRFDPGARLLLITPRRTVLVIADTRGGLRYEAYPHDAVSITGPAIRLTGGTLQHAGRHDIYSFANRGFGYRIDASRDPARPGAVLTVSRAGSTIQTEPAIAYSIADRRYRLPLDSNRPAP